VADDGVIKLDDSAWPLVVGVCPENIRDASIPPLIAFFDRVHAKKERFATVIDTRPLKTMPSAKWRRDITSWASDPTTEAASYRFNVGTAIVISSALARGVFVALGWLRKPASPVHAHGSMSEATEWCTDLLWRAGVPLSAKVRVFRESLAEEGEPGRGTAPKTAR
jgi:hypothetical protein